MTPFLLQSATRFIANCDRYYKVRWIYYKLRQVLQSAMIITNCDSTIIVPKLCHSTHLFYIPSRIYHCSPMDLSRESKTSTNTSEFKESVEMRNASDTKSESLSKVEKARFSKSICNASTSIVQVHLKII